MRHESIRSKKDARDAFTLWARFVQFGGFSQSGICRCDESLERVTGQRVYLSQPERDADYFSTQHELATWVDVFVKEMREPTAYVIQRHYQDHVELSEIAVERINLALDAIDTPNRCREVTGHLWKSVRRLYWLEQRGHGEAASHRHTMEVNQTRSVQRMHQAACEHLIEARAVYLQRLARDRVQAIDGGVLVNMIRRVMTLPERTVIAEPLQRGIGG